MSHNKHKKKSFMHYLGISFFSGILALAMVSNAFAQWRWVDDKGTIHISDNAPPASVSDDKILSRPSSSRPTVQEIGTGAGSSTVSNEVQPQVKSADELRLEAEQARIAAEQKKAEEDAKRIEDKRRLDACNAAKKRVELYNSGVRIRDLDSKGEYFYLDDKDIAQRKKQALADQREYCSRR